MQLQEMSRGVSLRKNFGFNETSRFHLVMTPSALGSQTAQTEAEGAEVGAWLQDAS